MRSKAKPTREERKLKVAEAGIMFALVLAITVFVGVKFASNDETGEATAQIIDPSPAMETITRVETLVEAETDTQVSLAEVEETPAASVAEVEEPAVQTHRVVTYAMAEQAYFDGKVVEAADLFDQYTAEHPFNAWGFYMHGLAQWKADDLVGAEESFLTALELKPDHQKSLINYGRVLLELDRADDARQQLEVALAANPLSKSAKRVLARAYHNLGQWENARAAYEDVLSRDRDDVWALNNLGLIHIEQENFADAVAPLARAASLRENEACIQNNLGVALERLGQYRAAEEAFGRALAADENYAKADESLVRVAELTESEELIPVDLAVLADEFTADPAADAGTEPAQVDMEVATAAVVPDEESVETAPSTGSEPDSE